MPLTLNAEKGLIFRVTHRDNIPWILDNGLHAPDGTMFDPNYRNIGLTDLIRKRAERIVPVPPGGTLHSYIAFYFTPFSMMMFNIKTGHNVVRVPNQDIVFMVPAWRLLLRTDAASRLPISTHTGRWRTSIRPLQIWRT